MFIWYCEITPLYLYNWAENTLFIFMPEAFLFMESTLTECKKIRSGKVGNLFFLLMNAISYFNCGWNCALRIWAKSYFCCVPTGNWDKALFLYTKTKKKKTNTCRIDSAPISMHFPQLADIKPWCRLCWDWGRSGQLSPLQLSCLYCTWGSQMWLVRCCSHGRNIPCTELYQFFWEKEEKTINK